MTKKSTIINLDEIREVFQDECKEEGKSFDKKEFQDFLKFLEIDFYDWVKENLRQFYKQ